MFDRVSSAGRRTKRDHLLVPSFTLRHVWWKNLYFLWKHLILQDWSVIQLVEITSAPGSRRLRRRLSRGFARLTRNKFLLPRGSGAYKWAFRSADTARVNIVFLSTSGRRLAGMLHICVRGRVTSYRHDFFTFEPQCNIVRNLSSKHPFAFLKIIFWPAVIYGRCGGLLWRVRKNCDLVYMTIMPVLVAW